MTPASALGLLAVLAAAAPTGPSKGVTSGSNPPAGREISVLPQFAAANTNLAVGAAAAVKNRPPAAGRRQGWIRVAADGRGFVDTSCGAQFVPRGFNYDRDHRMRLLEDYWETEWATVVEDFGEMKALGATVVRVHLQLARFMTAPDRANERALARLRQLLALAATTGVRLDITGLGCYRKADVPAWLEALGESERWRVQANFWRAIARTCADSPAVFCYNLINEPFVPAQARKAGDWLAGDLAGFSYVQALVLDPAGRAPHDIVAQWTGQMVATIRREDPQHLVTLGFLPNSGARFVQAAAQHLDFVSVHIYPRSGQLPEAGQTLRGFQVGKPLVVEEIFPLHCKPEELVGFMKDARAHVAGWISFYWGQTPEELKDARTVGEAITREWLQLLRGGW